MSSYNYPFKSVDLEIKLAVWQKARPIRGSEKSPDEAEWRVDVCGNVIHYADLCTLPPRNVCKNWRATNPPIYRQNLIMKHEISQSWNDETIPGTNLKTVVNMTEMQYSIDLEKNIIRCKYSGHLKAEKLIEHIVTIRNDPDFHNALNTISDIRKATFSEGFLEMNKIADFVENNSQARGNFKLALIVGKSTAESAEIYKYLAMDNHVKLYFDMEEAETWVGGRSAG